jgi:hypothetical protein
MTYKAFQEFYHEQSIKHLILHNHNETLISPPFATELCKDYSNILCIDGNKSWTIKLDLPAATSKFNSVITVGDSTWFIPYGIYDNFNVAVQLTKDFKPIYHEINMPGKGQFYSAATNGVEAFSFPLGYQDTSYGLYIKNDTIEMIPFDRQEHIKLHMGTVYANGRFWSAPRSDTPGYINFMSFDGNSLKAYPIKLKNTGVTRKYTDIIVKGNILYSLPFGETPGITEIIEFNTDTNTYNLIPLNIPDFAKKYNVGVLVGDVIIALPYGDEFANNSNLGLIFNTVTKEHFTFDIGYSFGGKYRFRSGIAFKDHAVFAPTGTPTCPLLIIDQRGNIIKKEMYENCMLGRPIVFNDAVHIMTYNFKNSENQVMKVDWL